MTPVARSATSVGNGHHLRRPADLTADQGSFFSSAGLASAAFGSAGAGKTSALLARFHSRTPSLWVPTARTSPPGEKARPQSVLLCGPSEPVSFFSAMLQSLMVL